MACAATTSASETITTTGPTHTEESSTTIGGLEEAGYGEPPVLPVGAPTKAALDAVGALLQNLFQVGWKPSAAEEVADAGDPRMAWLLADLMRFYQAGPGRDELVSAFSDLTGVEPDPTQVDFVWAMNHLIAWNLPAWDGYREAKENVYTMLDPTWGPFFDEDHFFDWRLVTWGGVLADTRDLGDNGPCNCIPSLDYPATTDASGGDWYPDGNVVFGVVVAGDAIALPKNQMEVHEMVNTTLGGRELGIPYCTLCASAQAYFVDDVQSVDRVVLRTSGLLSRSNKIMYDKTTGSAFDTFTGQALSGPLAADGVVLDQVSVVATTWADWKEAHPDTAIVAADGGIGRSYAADPLGGRDAAGPIFPVGDVDARLPVQEKVVGVIAPDGTPLAFPVEAIQTRLAEGQVDWNGVAVRAEDGIRIYDASGRELPSHQAYWFAWSQFYPTTLVWTGLDAG